MNENEPDPVANLDHQGADGSRDQKQKEHELVETMFRAGLEHSDRNLPPVEPPSGVHYTELTEAKPGEVLCSEWNTYRRQIGRLLAEGHEGRYALIKGEEIIGLFDTWEAAREGGLRRYLLEPFFVHAIRAEEPYLRLRGINLPWTSSPLP